MFQSYAITAANFAWTGLNTSVCSYCCTLPTIHTPSASEVYCRGDLLHTIQTSGIFTDSKEFVDRPLKADPATVLDAFRNLPDQYSNTSLLQFVEQWTENVTADFVPWEPPDWVEKYTHTSFIV